MIIFLAGLRQIPQDIYEAASHGRRRQGAQFFKITLPLLTPVIFFNAVVQTIEPSRPSPRPSSSSGGTGGPIDSTLFYTLYLYQEAFAYFRMGYASALAWILLVIIAHLHGVLVPDLANTGCTTMTDARCSLAAGEAPPSAQAPSAARRCYHMLPDRGLDRDALSAAVDARELVQARRRDLRAIRRSGPVLQPRRLYQRLERRCSVSFGHVLPELASSSRSCR